MKDYHTLLGSQSHFLKYEATDVPKEHLQEMMRIFFEHYSIGIKGNRILVNNAPIISRPADMTSAWIKPAQGSLIDYVSGNGTRTSSLMQASPHGCEVRISRSRGPDLRYQLWYNLRL